MLARWAGGSLRPVAGHVRAWHRVSGKIEAEVNSFHNCSLAHCPEGFRVLALSEDGEIEAIRHVSLPWEGWMWHPEREEKFFRNDINQLKNYSYESNYSCCRPWQPYETLNRRQAQMLG